MEEVYRNYLECYEVSNLGNVRRKLLGGGYKVINCSIMNRGYRYFQQYRDGKRINHLIHHIVAKLFIGERPENDVIDHIDRNKLNNCVDNLRYCSQLENMKNQDRYKQEITEQDPEKRHPLVCKLYREQNRDKVNEQKKEYYQNHKEHFQEYNKSLFEIKCDNCNEVRYITRCSINHIKRKGTNICRKCSAIKNLELANKYKDKSRYYKNASTPAPHHQSRRWRCEGDFSAPINHRSSLRQGASVEFQLSVM